MSKENENVDVLYEHTNRFKALTRKNIWSEINDLSRENDAVDMAEGFCDYISYKPLVNAIKDITNENDWKMYQYARNDGHLRLTNVVSKHYSQLLNRKVNALDQVLITIGAYGSLNNAITSLVQKGDEVILIEPFFDCYEPMVVMNEGTVVYVPLTRDCSEEVDQSSVLTSADWKLNDNDLEKAFSSKTKLIVLNTPNNPLGKVFTQNEIDKIAELCIKYNVICVSDEVYEHLAYESEHIRIATLPGMWQRTLTISSAGKVFSSTGVKIGWTIGPEELVKLCKCCQSIELNVCPTPLQEAIARCYEQELNCIDSPESYFNCLRNELKEKRDYLAAQLTNLGLKPIIPDAGYFMIVDVSTLTGSNKFSTDSKEYKDHKIVKNLIKKEGLALIPCTAFYGEDHKRMAENYVRFCFFKNDKTLKNATHILKNLK